MIDDKANSGPPRDPDEQELLQRYKQADLPRKKSLYLEVLDLIRTYHQRVGAGDWCFAEDINKVLINTPAEILSYKVDGKETSLYPIESFNFYNEYNLEIIKYLIITSWGALSDEFRRDINLSMYTVFAAIDPVLELHTRYSKENLSPYGKDGNLNQEYKSMLTKFNNEIETARSLTWKFFPTGDKNLELFFRLRLDARLELNQIKVDLEESRKINIKTREIITEGTIQKEASRFDATANKHRCRAMFAIFGAFVLSALAFVWVNLIPIMESPKNCVLITKSITHAIPGEFLCKFFKPDIKSFIFSSGLFVTLIYSCLRSYFANSQNEVSNRQRFNALNSYELLYRVATHKEDKSFIIQKAVECAYSHQPTGFVKQPKDNENQQQTFNIIPNLEKTARTTTDNTSGGGGIAG